MKLAHQAAIVLAAGMAVQPLPALDLQEFRVNGDVTATYDDNQSQAQRRRDIVEDAALSLQASLGWFHQLGRRNMIIVSGLVEAERFADITPLDRQSVGMGAAW